MKKLKAKGWQSALLAAFSIICSSQAASPDTAAPAAYSKRINEIEDFKQTNPQANFAEGGKDFCAPTSLSDYLIWLGHHSYPNLLPKADNAEAMQIALIKQLAGDDYMGTDPTIGTSPSQIMTGLKKYISDSGYKIKNLTYQGFRPCAKEFATGVTTPELNWLKSGSIAPRCCWLNLGWYTWDEASDTYTRVGGHWVALVGYGVNAKGAPSPDTIIVHDPLPRFGAGKTNEYIDLQKVTSGKLTGNYKGLPYDADGFYWYQSYTDGQRTKELKNYGLIDGGIILELLPL